MRLCYIRIGRYGKALPTANKSRNYLTGKYEIGISVYEAIERDGKYQIIIPEINNDSISSLTSFMQNIKYGADMQIFEVTGDLIGKGSDGEPLLTNCSVIKQIL